MGYQRLYVPKLVHFNIPKQLCSHNCPGRATLPQSQDMYFYLALDNDSIQLVHRSIIHTHRPWALGTTMVAKKQSAISHNKEYFEQIYLHLAHFL